MQSNDELMKDYRRKAQKRANAKAVLFFAMAMTMILLHDYASKNNLLYPLIVSLVIGYTLIEFTLLKKPKLPTLNSDEVLKDNIADITELKDDKLIILPADNLATQTEKYIWLLLIILIVIPADLGVIGLAREYINSNEVISKNESYFSAAFLIGVLFINWVCWKCYRSYLAEKRLAKLSPIKGIELSPSSLALNIKYVGGSIILDWMRKNKTSYLEFPWSDIEGILISPSVGSGNDSTPANWCITLSKNLSASNHHLDKYIGDNRNIWIFRNYLTGYEANMVAFIKSKTSIKIIINAALR